MTDFEAGPSHFIHESRSLKEPQMAIRMDTSLSLDDDLIADL